MEWLCTNSQNILCMQVNRRIWLKNMTILGAGLSIPAGQLMAASKPDISREQPDTGMLRLNSNENSYGPSPQALATMSSCIAGSNRYPWEKIPELIKDLAVKNGLSGDHVLIGAGSSQLIDAIVQLAALQKGSCIMAAPTFSKWKGAAASLGLSAIEVPLTSDKKHNLPAMLSTIRPDTRLVYVCNPNNPTGTICAYPELVSFVQEATKKTLVLLDEAYLEYAGEPSLCTLVADNRNLIVIKTFSKIYGLAGARIGYALAHPQTIERLGALQAGTNIGISTVSISGALASLNDDAFVQKTYSLNKEVRDFTVAQLEGLHIPCIASHTNFVYFSLIHYTRDFFNLLKTHRIEGTGIFEETGKYSRITIGTRQEMEQFIAAVQ